MFRSFEVFSNLYDPNDIYIRVLDFASTKSVGLKFLISIIKML